MADDAQRPTWAESDAAHPERAGEWDAIVAERDALLAERDAIKAAYATRIAMRAEIEEALGMTRGAAPSDEVLASALHRIRALRAAERVGERMRELASK